METRSATDSPPSVKGDVVIWMKTWRSAGGVRPRGTAATQAPEAPASSGRGQEGGRGDGVVHVLVDAGGEGLPRRRRLGGARAGGPRRGRRRRRRGRRRRGRRRGRALAVSGRRGGGAGAQLLALQSARDL